MLCISNSVASTRSLYFSSWIHLWHFLLGMMAPGMLFSFQASSLDLADEKKKKKKEIHKEHAVQNNICHWCGRNRKLHKQFGNYRFITTEVKSYRPFLTLNYPLVPCGAWAKYLVSLHALLTSPHQDLTLKNASPEWHWPGSWWIPSRAIIYVYM